MAETCISAYIAVDENNVVSIQNDNYVFLTEGNGDRLLIPVNEIDLNNGEPTYVQVGGQVFHLVIDVPRPRPTEVYLGSADVIPSRPTSNAVEVGLPVNSFGEWTEAPTKLLVSLYPDMKLQVEKRKIISIKKMWELISESLCDKGYEFTPVQCANKWKTLERSWKKKTENNNKTGRGRKACPYDKELTDILSKKASVFPELTMGTGKPVSRATLMAKCGITPTQTVEPEEDSNSEEPLTPGSRDPHPGPSRATSPGEIMKRPRNAQQQLVYLQKELVASRLEKNRLSLTRAKATEKYREEKLELLRERNEQLKIQNELLKTIANNPNI